MSSNSDARTVMSSASKLSTGLNKLKVMRHLLVTNAHHCESVIVLKDQLKWVTKLSIPLIVHEEHSSSNGPYRSTHCWSSDVAFQCQGISECNKNDSLHGFQIGKRQSRRADETTKSFNCMLCSVQTLGSPSPLLAYSCSLSICVGRRGDLGSSTSNSSFDY